MLFPSKSTCNKSATYFHKKECKIIFPLDIMSIIYSNSDAAKICLNHTIPLCFNVIVCHNFSAETIEIHSVYADHRDIRTQLTFVPFLTQTYLFIICTLLYSHVHTYKWKRVSLCIWVYVCACILNNHFSLIKYYCFYSLSTLRLLRIR